MASATILFLALMPSLFTYLALLALGEKYGFGVNEVRTLIANSSGSNELKYVMFSIFCLTVLNTFAGRRLKPVFYFSLFALLSAWMSYRVVNVFVLYYSGQHLDKTLFEHIEPGAFSEIFTVKLLVLIIPLGLAFLTAHMFRSLDFSELQAKRKIYLILIVAASCWSLVYIAKQDRITFPAKAFAAKFKAEKTMAATPPELYMLKSFSRQESFSTSNNLTPDVTEKLFRFGLLYNSPAGPPYIRQQVFSSPLTFQRKKHAPPKPNIILVVMESLSSRFIESYGGRFDGLTGNLDKFISVSTSIGPTYNASTPTINGLISILCSTYPTVGHEEMENNQLKPVNMLCLPGAIKESGYTSYLVMAADPYYTGKKTLLMHNGMDVVEGYEEIEQLLGEPPNGSWGYSDLQLSRYVRASLEQNRFKEPFLLVVENVDMHPAFKMKKDTLTYGDGSSVLLNLAYTSDRAFGSLWDYFTGSPYAANTIFVLTADHAVQPGTEVKQVMGLDPGYFDVVPFVIHDPLHELPREVKVTSSSVDIAPTILHLLDINTDNPFDGLSVFDPKGRPSYPAVLGSHTYLFYYNQNNTPTHFSRINDYCQESTTEGKPEAFNQCDYMQWWRYKRWLTENNNLWEK